MKNNHLIMVMGFLALFSVLFFIFFGFTGVRFVLGLSLVIILPFYLLIRNLPISKGEKLFFSLFVALPLFPSLVYWLGFAVPFRMSMILVVLLILGTGLGIQKFVSK